MSSIDFLKTCRTNVQVAEGLLDTRYILYKPQRPESARDVAVSAIIHLRKNHVLCALSREDGVWVFELPEAANEDIMETLESEYDLESTEDGLLRDITAERNGRAATIRGLFVDSVAGALTFLLGQEHAILPIAPFQYLLAPAGGRPSLVGDWQAVVEVRTKLTDSGAFHVSTRIRHSDYVAAQSDRQATLTDAVLAPYGCRANTLPNNEDITARASRARATSGPLWEVAVTQILSTYNINVEENEQWLLVAIGGHGEDTALRLTWPSRLCLIEHHSSSPHDTAKKDWSYWFEPAFGSRKSFEDPFGAAERWFIGATERAIVSTATPIFDAPTADAMAGQSNFIAETPIATSSPFNQRLIDQQAAAMGIYPTPPDGFAPHQHQHNPTSDGPSTTMQMDPDPMPVDAEQPGSEVAEARGDSMESVRETQGFEPHSDDLFGEMAVEMDFGVNEIDDADFDYFDDPDDVRERHPVGQDIDMEDTSTHGRQSTGLSSDEDHPQPDAPGREPDEPSAETQNASTEQATLNHEMPQPPDGQQRTSTDLAELASEEPEPPMLEKALSPFGIRERILPPPIPASTINNDSRNPSMKPSSSTYDAVVFNENVDMHKRYVGVSATSHVTPIKADISLPFKTKKTRANSEADIDSGWTDEDESSDEDMYNPPSKIEQGGSELPPRVPWENRKRKRTSQSTAERYLADQTKDARFNAQSLDVVTDEEIASVLNALRLTNGNYPLSQFQPRRTVRSLQTGPSPELTPLQELLELTDLQMNFVAQMVSEQALSTTRTQRYHHEDTSATPDTACTMFGTSLQTLVRDHLERVLPQLDDCVPASLAAMRETATRPIPTQNRTPQAPQSRMPPREGSMHSGPDYFPLQAPFISIQRGSDHWEMLPTAASFWTALGLGPASGPKDITAILIAPATEDLLALLASFMQDLSTSYESSKLGRCTTDPHTREEIELGEDSNLSYENGILAVHEMGDTATLEGVLAGYASACETLGGALADLGLDEPDRTIVILLLDPFEDSYALKYLCGCFWKLFNAYKRSTSSRSQVQAPGDLVLQILPVSAVAAPDALVMLDAEEMSALAMEIYDRCPPSAQRVATMDAGFALPIIAAPAVELAPITNRRIAFQPTADPSSDMMREGSVLHLAYALSPDRLWMVVCWIDPTGRYQTTATACLRGRTFHEVVTEVWDRTLEIISAREVMWRVCIVADGVVDPSIQQCWRDVAASKKTKQVVHITLLSIDDDPLISLSPPLQSDCNLSTTTNPGSGFLTPPVTTPSASAATVSPDPSGHAANAPPTPTPTENTAATESDSDAYLLDVADESWGMLLSPAVMCDTASADLSTSVGGIRRKDPLMKGMVFRRGASSSGSFNVPLEALSVDLHWEIRVRAAGVDEGPPKQAEATLRDVLRMYRQLALLGRLRKVSNFGDGEQMVPVHMLHVRRGVEALDGYLE